MNRMSVVTVNVGMKRLKVCDGKFLHGIEQVNPFANDELLRLIHISILCNETEISMQGEKYGMRGSPTENALIHVAIASGVDVAKIREEYPVLKINYRSENRNFMSSLHKTKNTGTDNGASFLIALKGSPAEVLSMCSWHIKDGVKSPLAKSDKFNVET